MFRTHLMFLSVHLTVRVQSGLVLDSDSKFARPSIGLDLSQQALNDYNENEGKRKILSTPRKISVSLASSLEKTKGPKYPHNTVSNAYSLRPSFTLGKQFRKLESRKSKTTRKSDLTPLIRNEYDPFDFHSSKKSTTKQNFDDDHFPASNQLNSRLSVLEPNYRSQKRKYKKPVIISYEEALKSIKRSKTKNKTMKHKKKHIQTQNKSSSNLQYSYAQSPLDYNKIETGKEIVKPSGSIRNRERINYVIVSPVHQQRNYFPMSRKDNINSIAKPPAPERYISYYEDMQEPDHLPAHLREDNLWPGYSHVVDIELDDRVSDNRVDNFFQNKNFQGDHQRIISKPPPIIPALPAEHRANHQASQTTTYSERYGWTEQEQAGGDMEVSINRKWTSLDLAKPVWEDEYDWEDEDLIESSFEQLDINQDIEEKETFGTWDDKLDLIPLKSRSEELEDKWVLVSHNKAVAEDGFGGNDNQGSMAD